MGTAMIKFGSAPLSVGNTRLIAAVCLAIIWSLPPIDHGFSANKVTTKRIFVPEETSKEPSGPATEIPTDALPSLELKSNNPSDGEPTEDGSEETEADLTPPPPPDVLRDLTKLPEPVRRMRELILEAANSGDIEKLRNLIGIGDNATTLSIGGLDGDPIAFLKESSGDDEGYEILAILIEVLEAGFVHLDAGTEEELFVWPYFFAWPLDKLNAIQKVELYQILTAGDVEDSQNFGGYIFYRVGIKPDGQWSFFVAGD